MEIRWYRKGQGNQPSRSASSLPEQVSEDAPDTIRRERHFSTWMDEVIRDHAANGGFDDLEGKGQPLAFVGHDDGTDMMDRVMKNAGVLPPWLELQREIGKQIRQVLTYLDRHPESDVKSDLKQINRKIQQFNQICPSPLLYKPPITRENLARQADNWVSSAEGSD